MKKISNLNLVVCPQIVFLSIFEKDIDKWIMRERVSNLLTVARLTVVGNWKSADDILLSIWYREVWDGAINGKLICNIKIKKGITSNDVFTDI